MAKKLIAILLALTVVVFAFAACGDTKGAETTTEATEAADVTTEAPAAETTAAPAETTAAPAGETTAAPAATTTAAPAAATTAAPAATTTAAAAEATTAAAKAPQTKEEIVAYFNTAINSAKKDSKSIKSNYMKHSVAGEITGIPSALDSIGQSLIKNNMGEDDSKHNVTWSTAADKNANFPVEGETYASTLTAADVQSATLTEANGVYTITIKTVADAKASNYKHGVGHAPKAFNAVLPSIIDGYIPGIAKSLFSVGTVSCAYPSSTIKVTVDSATGHVKTANYLLNWTLYIPLNGKDVVLPFSTENDYTINW